jgi:chorismate--pyruvate lyase
MLMRDEDVCLSDMKDSLPVAAGWRDACAVLRRRLPVVMQDWLFDPCSLTLRLQQACPGSFSVRVLSQRRQRPLRDERRLLGMPEHELALVRQVQLLCAGQPWVFARTVVPLRSLAGRGRRLACLGNRPLGAMLFADKSVRRGRLQIARLMAGDRLFDSATRGLANRPADIWGRRSLFHYAGHPLLVNEIFLPDVGCSQSRLSTRFRFRQAA